MWTIKFSRPASKQFKRHSQRLQLIVRTLTKDLETNGPFPGKHWPHYSKLKGKKSEDRRHCHLIKGKPTYVCCWQVTNKHQKIVEVYYVGTHEKAPY